MYEGLRVVLRFARAETSVLLAHSLDLVLLVLFLETTGNQHSTTTGLGAPIFFGSLSRLKLEKQQVR